MSRIEKSNEPHDGSEHDEANCPSCQADIAAMTDAARLALCKELRDIHAPNIHQYANDNDEFQAIGDAILDAANALSSLIEEKNDKLEIAYSTDQWWYKELEAIAESLEQKRALAVVRRMIKHANMSYTAAGDKKG